VKPAGEPPGEALVLSQLRQVHSLPALPMVVNAVTKRISNQQSGAGEIARLLAHDQGLTVRVLRLANSAFYSPQEEVRSPEHAVVLLGLGTVRSIILKASIFSAFDVNRARPFWLHALGAACAARAVARVSGLGRGEDAFVMGLLHDLGKLAITEHLPELAAKVREHLARHGGLIREAEVAVLGCDHAAVGRFLCEHWSLPRDYRDAIAGHHDFALASEENRPWAALVHLADIISRAMLIGNAGDMGMPVLDAQALPLLKLREDQFGELFRAAEDELGRAEVFFTILSG
jgi:HD-like signal output (HDOD) protein